MFKKSAVVISFIALAACGGSTTSESPTFTSVSNSGFAAADSQVGRGESFDVVDVTRIIADPDGNITTAQQDVEVSIAQDGQSIDVVIDDEAYTLVPQSNGDYGFTSGTTSVNFRRGLGVPEVEIIDVGVIIDNELNDSFLVIGFDTNPQTISALSGSAQMDGAVQLSSRNGFDVLQLEGPAALNVNFDTSTVSGSFTIGGDGSSLTNFSFGESTFALEETALVGNAFDGTFDLADGAIGGSIEEATYNGRFYGSEAQSAAGQIFLRLEHGEALDGTDNRQTFVEGAFVVTE